jgi:thiosulfate/3-mercaptopyruvate sulfurtransferase
MNISNFLSRAFGVSALLMFCLILISPALGVENGGYPNSGFLVTTQWLQDHLKDPGLRIIDRQDIEPEDNFYVEGHVPNSIRMTTDIIKDERLGIPEMLVVKKLIGFLQENGVTPDHHIVIIGSSDRLPATTRLFWALELLGHKKISIVDGGTDKWVTEKKPWTTEIPRFDKSTYQVNLDRSKLMTGDELAGYVGMFKELGIVVADSSRPDEFAGIKMRRETEKLGHIPGAINLFFGTMLTGHKYKEFKTADEIKQVLYSKGITPDKNDIFTCVSGCFGTVLYFGARLLNYPKAAVYDGAWIEWSRKGYPVETTVEVTGTGTPQATTPAQQEPSTPKPSRPSRGC